LDILTSDPAKSRDEFPTLKAYLLNQVDKLNRALSLISMNTEPTTLSLSKDYSFRLSGEQLHDTLVALIDAERVYRKHGFIGMADNAIQIHQTLLGQIK
jgi:hypothetical protein